MVDISRHPMLMRLYETQMAIEGLPPSRQATDLSSAATALMLEMERYLDRQEQLTYGKSEVQL